MNSLSLLRFGLYLHLACVPLFFFSCAKDKCDGEGNYSNASNLGTIAYDPDGVTWSIQTGQIRFKSNKGNAFDFKVEKQIDYSTVDLYLNEKMYSACTKKEYNYVRNQEELLTIWSDEVPFKIQQTRARYIWGQSYHDSVNIAELKKMPEAIVTRIGYSNHSFYTPDTNVYVATDLLLNDSLFLNVNKIPSKEVPQFSLYIKNVYFQRGQGMIAFELNNGELWTKQ